MAFVSPLRQATVLLTLALAVASSDTNPMQSDLDDAPAVGPSLAQVKFGGPAHSAVTESDPMTHFGSLDDIFDEPIQGFDETTENMQQARPRASFLHTMLASLIPKSSSAFANLDDIFDEKAEVVQEAEVAEFSVSKWLSNPSFYFTIAILICGGLILTSSSDAVEPERQPQQQHPQQQQQQQQAQDIAPSTGTPADTTAAEADAPRKANPSRLVPSVTTIDLGAAASEAEAPADGPNPLLAAADACKAGEAGSYASFCKLLAAQSSVQ